MRESQDSGGHMDRVSDEPGLSQQPSQTSGQDNNVAVVPEQPDVSMPDLGPPETPGDTVETSDGEP